MGPTKDLQILTETIIKKYITMFLQKADENKPFKTISMKRITKKDLRKDENSYYYKVKKGEKKSRIKRIV